MTVAELVVKISADASGLQKEVKGVEKELGSLEKTTDKAAGTGNDLAESFGKISSIIKNTALVGLFLSIDKAIIDLTKDFADAEIAASRLDRISRIRGFKDASDDISDLAGEIQKLTGASDDLVKQLGAELLAQGKSQAQTERLLKLAADLSAVTGQDLATSVRQLSSTYSGMAGQLGKLNPELKDLTEEQLRNGAAIDILERKYGGLAKEFQGSLSVGFSRLSENFGDLRENLGAVFAPMINGLVTLGNKILETVNKGSPAFKALGEVINVVYSLVVGAVGGVAGFGIAVNNLSPKVKNLWNIITGKAKAEKEAEEAALAHAEAVRKAAEYAEAERKAINASTTALAEMSDERLRATIALYEEAAEKARMQRDDKAARKAEENAARLQATLNKRIAEAQKKAQEDARAASEAKIKATTDLIKKSKEEIEVMIQQEKLRAKLTGAEIDSSKIRNAALEKYIELSTMPGLTAAQQAQAKAILDIANAWTKVEQEVVSAGQEFQIAFDASAWDEPTQAAEEYALSWEEISDAVSKASSIAKTFFDLAEMEAGDAMRASTEAIGELVGIADKGAGTMVKTFGQAFALIADIQQEFVDVGKKAADAINNIQLKILDNRIKAEQQALANTEKNIDKRLAAEISMLEELGLTEEELTERKKQVNDRYEKEKASAAEASAKKIARIQYDRAVIEKDIAIAQAKIDERKTIASLGIFARKKDKQAVKDLYAELISSIESLPLPAYAKGTNYHPGGMAIVGEEGPEIVNLPRGSSVTPNNKMGNSVNVNIYSPVAVTPSEASAMFKRTAQDLAFSGVL